MSKASDFLLGKVSSSDENDEAIQPNTTDITGDSAWKYIDAGDISGFADWTNRNMNYRDIPFLGQLVGHTADAATQGVADMAQFVGADGVSNYLNEKAQEGESYLPPMTTPELSLDYVTDPNGLASATGMLVGSMLSMAPATMLVPESAAIKVGNLLKGLPKIGTVASEFAPKAVKWAATGPVEAAMEGGNTERQMLQNGATPEEAKRAAWNDFYGNVGLLTATNALEGGLLGKVARVKTPIFQNGLLNTASKMAGYAPATAAEAALQGYEEGAQQGIQEGAMNGQMDANHILNPNAWDEEQWDNAKFAIAGGLPLVGGSALIRHVGGRGAQATGDPMARLQQAEASTQAKLAQDAQAQAAEQAAAQPAFAVTEQPQETQAAQAQESGLPTYGQKFYTITDEVSDTALDDDTEARLNILAHDYQAQFGEPLMVTSMKRNGGGGSWHDSGQAFDLAGGGLETNENGEREWLMQRGQQLGLTPLDEYAHPSEHATGGHIHFSNHEDGSAPAIDGASMGGGLTLSSGDQQIDAWIQEAADAHGVPANLLSALLDVESGYNVDTPNSEAGAIGIAQFMPGTADAMGIDPRDPHQAIDGAARLLKQEYDNYGNWSQALEAYNGGEGNVGSGQTQAYAQKVLGKAGDISHVGGSSRKGSSTNLMNERPSFDLDSDDSASRKMIADFIDSWSNRAGVDDMNDIESMLDANGRFKNTKENRDIVREKWGDELQQYADAHMTDEQQQAGRAEQMQQDATSARKIAQPSKKLANKDNTQPAIEVSTPNLDAAKQQTASATPQPQAITPDDIGTTETPNANAQAITPAASQPTQLSQQSATQTNTAAQTAQPTQAAPIEQAKAPTVQPNAATAQNSAVSAQNSAQPQTPAMDAQQAVKQDNTLPNAQAPQASAQAQAQQRARAAKEQRLQKELETNATIDQIERGQQLEAAAKQNGVPLPKGMAGSLHRGQAPAIAQATELLEQKGVSLPTVEASGNTVYGKAETGGGNSAQTPRKQLATKASYSDKFGGRRGSLNGDKVTVWDGSKGGVPKKEMNFAMTLGEIEKALSRYGNDMTGLRGLVKDRYDAAVERWIKETKNPDVREKRRHFWENDTQAMKGSPAYDRAVDSYTRVAANLYEKATGQKAESPFERRMRERANTKSAGAKDVAETENNSQTTESEAAHGGNAPQADTAATNAEAMAWIDAHPFRYDKDKSVDENIKRGEAYARAFIKQFGTTDQIDTPERQALRERITDELYGKGAKKKEGKVWLIVGVPASGKSTIANPIQEKNGAMLIDADEAKEKLPEFAGGLLAGAVHEESSVIANAVLKRAIESQDNIVMPVVGKTLASLQKKIQKFKEAGYEVNIEYVDLPIEKAIQRVKSRFVETGRLVSPKYLASVGLKPKENYDKLKVTEEVDSYEAWNNDVKRGDPPILNEHQVSSRENRLGGRRDSRSSLRGSSELGNRGEEAQGSSRRGGSAETAQSTPDEPVKPNTESRSDDQSGFSLAHLAEKAPVSGAVGKAVTVVTDKRKELHTRYRIVPASALTTSNVYDGDTIARNGAYPQPLQPRERSGRKAMQVQTDGMAADLHPAELEFSRNLNQGAPLIRKDGVVLNGNGRTMAITRAYQLRNASGKAYTRYLCEHAEDFGFTKAQMQAAVKAKGTDKPILVRELLDDVDDASMTEIINSKVGGASMSASEQATADAKSITASDFDGYDVESNGDLTKASNDDFVARLLHKLAGPDELNRYTDKNGGINQDGYQRVKRAIFSRAYSDADLIAKMAESMDDAIKNISNGLQAASANIARLNLKMHEGRAYEYPLAKTIAQAVKKYNAIKEGKAEANVEAYANENATSLTGGDPEAVVKLVQALDDYHRSGKNVGIFLNRLARLIDGMGSPKEDENALFAGGEAEPRTLAALIDRAKELTNTKGELDLSGEKKYSIAYHGTAADFDQFDVGRIGTGEGSQAHGWGLYFAKNREVSERYRDLLTDAPTSITIDGETYHIEGSAVLDVRGNRLEENAPRTIAVRTLIHSDSKETAVRKTKNALLSETEKNEVLDALQQMKGIQFQKDGMLAKVEVPEEDVLLDEQKSLMEQPPAVCAALEKLGICPKVFDIIHAAEKKGGEKGRKLAENYFSKSWDDADKMDVGRKLEAYADGGAIYDADDQLLEAESGQAIYQQLTNELGSARDASLALRDAGVEGIKYDGQKDGDCYVVFDDKAVSIIRKLSAERAKAAEVRATEDLKREILRAFPGAKNLRDDGDRMTFTMPNGARVEIRLHDSMHLSPAEAARARKEHGLKEGVTITVNGAEYTLNGKAFIELSKRGKVGTVYHEALHAAMDLVLTKKEKDALLARYGSEEVAADAYRDFMVKLARDEHAPFGKLWRKIHAAIRAIADHIWGITHSMDDMRTARRAFETLSTGEAWGAQPRKKSHGFSIFSHAEAAERPIDRAAVEGDNESEKSEVRKLVSDERLLNHVKDTQTVEQVREMCFARDKRDILRLTRKVERLIAAKDPRAPIFRNVLKQIVAIVNQHRRDFYERDNIERLEEGLRRHNKGREGSRLAESLSEVRRHLDERRLEGLDDRSQSAIIPGEAKSRHPILHEIQQELTQEEGMEDARKTGIEPAHRIRTRQDAAGLHSWRDIETSSRKHGGDASLTEHPDEGMTNEHRHYSVSRSDNQDGSSHTQSKEETKERAKGWLHSVGDKLAKGLHLKGDKIMLEEDAKDPTRDINLKQAYLASPSRVAEKVKTFRVLYVMADRALNKVVSLRDGFERKLNQSLALVKGKDDRQDLFDLLLRGDAEGRVWTRQELLDDGVKENVADAYIGIRRQLNRAYHLVNDARRKPTPKSETVDKARLDFLQANKFVTDLSVTDKGNGKYLVSYKEYKNYPKQYKEITADMVERFRRDPGIQVVGVKEAKTESGHAITDADGKPLYDVTTTEGPAELNKLTGYIPHFFHEYFLRVVGKDGHTRTIGSARNQREAVMKAEAWMKENQLADGETIHVQPKTFDINKALGVTDGDFAPVMGDKDFLRVQQNLAKQNDMTLAEAKDMLDGAVRLKGRHRFFGNAMHRTGAAGFETDLDWALRHYFNSASRYVAMETEFKPKAISYFERVFGAFDKDYDNNLLAKYCKDYINDINGNPSSLEQAISKALNSTWLFKKVLIPTFGDRAALTLGNGVANKISYLTLGLNMSSALLNFTQLMNSAAYIGDVSSLVKMLAKGSHHTYSLGELRILKETGVLNDIGIDSGSGYDKLRSGGTPTLGTGRIARTLTGLNRGVDFLGNKSMFFFQQADAICRRGTVLAAYEKARSEGKTHAEAIAFAKDVNNKANFQYGVQDAPNIFRRGSIISQMVLQFKKYGFKELEVMADFSPWSKKTSRKQKLMFWGMYALLCGAMGVPALDWLDEIFGEKTGFYTKDELQKTIIHLCGGNKRLATVFMYGLPAALNINLSSRAGLSDVIPTSLGDFAGPALSKSVRLAQDTLGGDWANALRDVNPGLYNLYAAGMGESRGKRGRLNDRYTTLWDRALRAVGFRSVDETVPTDMQRIISRDKAKLTKERQEAQDAYIENPTSENKQRLRDLGVSDKTVQKEAEKKNQTREERTQGTVPKKEKERYQTLTDFMKE